MSNTEMSKLQQMRLPFLARICQDLCVGPGQGLISLFPIVVQRLALQRVIYSSLQTSLWGTLFSWPERYFGGSSSGQAEGLLVNPIPLSLQTTYSPWLIPPLALQEIISVWLSHTC